MSVQEAVELMSNPHMERLFGPEILGRLPSTGHDRVRRTTLVLIGKSTPSRRQAFCLSKNES